MLLVKVKLIDNLYRIVDSFKETVVYKRNGKPWDGGGHANVTTAIQQASLINSGVEKDTTAAKGVAGERGRSGNDGLGLNWRGHYNQTATYNKNDIVRFDGSVWIWISDTPGNAPVKQSSNWDIFVEKGEDGPPGQSSSGSAGPPGVGIPGGGLVGQVLAKASSLNFDTEWINESASSGSSILTFEAGENIGALKAVFINNDAAFKADNSILFESSGALGVTTTAASVGEQIQVQTSGVVTDASWNWVSALNPAIYLGADGALTQSAPSSGHVKEVAIALSDTSIFVSPKNLIVLS